MEPGLSHAGRPVIGVLIRPPRRPPPAPIDWPFARAALDVPALVVFGGQADADGLVGLSPTPEGWMPVTARPDALFDRFPSRTHPADHARLLETLAYAPVFNPPPLDLLLADKLRTQMLLGDLGMPTVESDPRRFHTVLPGFAKPRFGSFGRGVHLVHRATTLPPTTLVQRAIPAPGGLAGVALRILAQRTPDGVVVRSPVARVSTDDPVVNRARGADVLPVHTHFPEAEAKARALAFRVMERLPDAIEVGIDAVLDADHHPHLIEVNSRPRGRLAALAATDPTFAAEHLEACRQPLLTLLSSIDRA